MIRVFNHPIHKVKEAAAMKIVESAQKCNSEQIANNMSSIVEQLKATVRSAAKAGDSFDSVERKAIESVLQIGFEALQLLVALQGDGNLGKEIQTADEKLSGVAKPNRRPGCVPFLANIPSSSSHTPAEKTSRSACVPSAPVCRFPRSDGRFCCRSSPKCSVSIRHTIRR